MERALQQRPPAVRPMQAGSPRHAALAGVARTTAQLRLAEEINAGPAVARLMTLDGILNRAAGEAGDMRPIQRHPLAAGNDVIQRSDDEADEQIPAVEEQLGPQPDQPQGQLPDPPEGQPQAPPQYLLSDINYSSRAGPHAPLSQRSLYLADGSRLRLNHPNGPTLKKTALARYTFREKPPQDPDNPPQDPQFYTKMDYRRLRADPNAPRDEQGKLVVAHMLKPAEVGDPGKLFEIDPQHEGHTHPSRGRPVAEQDIQDPEVLNMLVQIAEATDAARQNPGFNPEVYNNLVRSLFGEQEVAIEEEEDEEEEEEEEEAPPDVEQDADDGLKRKTMDEPHDDDDQPQGKIQKLPGIDDDG